MPLTQAQFQSHFVGGESGYTNSRQPLASLTSSSNIPRSFHKTLERSRSKRQPSASARSRGVMEGSDADASSGDMSSPPSDKDGFGRCFCGKEVGDMEGGIYCSVACARSDAFSSLCYKPSNSISSLSSVLPSSQSEHNFSSVPLSRNPSSASTASNSSEDWTASHYRRLARAESRRDERREERRRRRADNATTGNAGSSTSSICSRSTVMSTSSSASRNVPELVGGHSRNPSTASSISSVFTTGSLSRNPSSASTTSTRSNRRHHGGAGGVQVDCAIMEDDDEEESITFGGEDGGIGAAAKSPRIGAIVAPKPYTPSSKGRGHGHRHKGSQGGLSISRLKQLEAFGMGKDMRDVLEEIIQMEKGFDVNDQEERDPYRRGDQQQHSAPFGHERQFNKGHTQSQSTSAKLYTATFDKPPRTPSPMSLDRDAEQRAAPGAPKVHRRSTVSHSNQDDMLGVSNFMTGATRSRPSSYIGGHQSSLSESHTALYLATASPEGPTRLPYTFADSSVEGVVRKSASPSLRARTSLTFTPEADGPSISTLPSMPSFRQSMNGPTPQKRRNNISPAAKHPTMDNWRFPSSAGSASRQVSLNPPRFDNGESSSNMATPTKAPLSHTHSHSNNTTIDPLSTPCRNGNGPNANQENANVIMETPAQSNLRPQLLWPSNSSSSLPGPPPLAPALFPASPMGNGTPEFSAMSQHDYLSMDSVTGSGLRLGSLLGSGGDDGDGDVDMDEDDSPRSSGGSGDGRGGYLPVFLEAEGFREGRGRW